MPLNVPTHVLRSLVASAPSPRMALEEARKHLARSASARKAQRTGASWERTVITLAKAHGWMVHHQRPAMTSKGWRSSVSGDTGFPDLVLAHPSRGVICAELKSGRGSLTDEQRAWHFALQAGGCEVHVWRPEQFEIIKARLSGGAR